MRPKPHRQRLLNVVLLEALVAEDDGTKVVLMTDHPPHTLVDGARRLLQVPVRTGQGLEVAGLAGFVFLDEIVEKLPLELHLRVLVGRVWDACHHYRAPCRIGEVQPFAHFACSSTRWDAMYKVVRSEAIVWHE
jgi:hypothetical protein